MCQHNGARDRQPEPEARGPIHVAGVVAAHEWFEHDVLACIGNAGDLKSKIDNLIAGEVSGGKLTSAQATELQGVFKSAFGNGADGAGGPAGAGGAHHGHHGAPPPADGSSSTDSTSSSSGTSTASDILQQFLQSLQNSLSASSPTSYSASGSSSTSGDSGSSFSALLINYQT
jgi:hypothetical protein